MFFSFSKHTIILRQFFLAHIRNTSNQIKAATSIFVSILSTAGLKLNVNS